jgi:hypothetical protein
MLVELRIGGGDKGAQTVFPGSTHESGERIEWVEDGEPARIGGSDLKRYVSTLAAGALLVRNYPPSGARHDAALVLGGWLARIPTMEAADIEHFVKVVARAAGDEEAEERGRSAAGEPTPGWPRMREVWGGELTNKIAEWLGAAQEDGRADDNSALPDSQTDKLIALAEDADLFHTAEGVSYADVVVNNHRETWPIPTKDKGGFAHWLRHRFYQATGGAPNSQSLTTALSTLAAKALYEGPEREVYTRVAALTDRIYLDLCDEQRRAVEIDTEGWRVTAEPPVRFQRRRGMLPLPLPVPHTRLTRGEAIRKFRGFVNVASDDDFTLLLSYIFAALSGRGPFPLLIILGPPGSAKSTMARIVKGLVDPNKAPLRAPPRSNQDVFIAARNGYMPAFDNLSHLPDWLSDTLCLLATGGGYGTRELYTDDEEILFDAQRPVVVTGIDNVVTRGDLTDRSIFLTAVEIPEGERRSEKEFFAAFDPEKPAILGALLDIVALGLRELPSVTLQKLPRMADFAIFATACERGGEMWEAGLFESAYAVNRAQSTDAVIEDNMVADAIRGVLGRAKPMTFLPH